MPFPKPPTFPATDTPTTDAPEPSLAATFESRRELLLAMSPEEAVVPHGLDPHGAMRIMNGSLGPIAAVRDELIAECGEDARAVLDELPIATDTARHALVMTADVDGSRDLGEWEDALRKEHSVLLADAHAFGVRGLIDPARVDVGRPVQGYRVLIHSTLFLVHLLREQWPVIEGKTALTHADLDRAERLGDRFANVLDARDAGAIHRPAIDLRTRAVAHAVRTYDEVRRYLTYVRWSKGDADTIAPSLYSGRRRSRGGSSEPVVVDAPTPVAPLPMEPMPGVPNNGGGPFQE